MVQVHTQKPLQYHYPSNTPIQSLDIFSEYYSVIKFLVENSKNGIGYTKINYENTKWTVQGEMENFSNFERFENNILRKYPSSELGYLKDNDTATVFEYVLEPF